jgi:hypothetical protein
MALVTLATLGKAVKETLTTGTTDGDYAQSVIDRVEAILGSEIGFVFAESEYVERMQADYEGVITLPVRPVSEVESVATPAGLLRAGWEFDGLDEVDGLESHEVVDVTFTAGFSTPPADYAALAAVALSCCVRLWHNPEGVRQQTVGAISETLAAGSGDSGTVYFTPQERRVIDSYGQRATSWRLGPRRRQPSTATTFGLPVL